MAASDPPEPHDRTTPFLTADWRWLVIANFEVDPALLAARIPAGTVLDPFEGRTLVSVVGFLFLDTRVLGVPVPGHRDFEEVNLRFYVRSRDAAGGWRRSVAFVKELVPRPAIATLARLCYQEPYQAVPMHHRVEAGPSPEAPLASIAYEWKLGGRWHSIGARVSGAPALPAPGSEAEFTIEHYWGTTALRNGGAREYRVQHPPWRVWPAEAWSIDMDVRAVYGAEWGPALDRPPTLVLVAEGSPVSVFPGRMLGPAAA
ncbi:MAG TPA: DUF2071 domain-containing protein [Candidatus Eisenbacteria bacterium]|nr:DUF2071 domain-containing protein [Candidatus Eisenbacteria bacterium]